MFGLCYGQPVIHIFLSVKKLFRPLQTFGCLFYLAKSDEVKEVARVNYTHQKDGADLTGPLERSLMILLLLENVKSILASPYSARYVNHLIFALALVIWRLRCGIRLIVAIIETQLRKFGKAMFKTDSVKSDAAHLYL